ncbi:hypothetical protein [Actinoplanes sp. N902-109]|uniref:hypothetical protein n=1 Tax=Actinoplanes sp. (strain N902-109) TaxID=649831 RepID=UPI0005A233CB|nr:hypothetical protein [Actinoplanes sp. N902-109]
MTATATIAASVIAVDRGVWADADVAAMIAPPVVVSSLPVPPGGTGAGQPESQGSRSVRSMP